MITGSVIGFILWAVWLLVGVFSLRANQRIDYPKIAMVFVLVVGLGTSIGYLFQ